VVSSPTQLATPVSPQPSAGERETEEDRIVLTSERSIIP
jgi:hypothetical protein